MAKRELGLLTVVGHDLIYKPDGALLGRVLVAVNFLLLECPLGKCLSGVCPHRDPCGHMHKPEVTRLALPRITFIAVHDVEIEERVIVT